MKDSMRRTMERKVRNNVPSMKIKAIFCGCSDEFWMDVAKRLEEENGWSVCYWTSASWNGVSRSEAVVRQRFPHAVYHSSLEAVRGIPPPDGPKLKPFPVDEELLRDLAWHESVVLNMMDRIDPGDAFAYHERIRLYHSLMSYWSSVLEHYKPDVVVFPTPPHMIYDYVVYVLARRRRIRTVMFRRTAKPGLIYPVSNFESGLESVIDAYQEKIRSNYGLPVQLSPDAEQYFSKLARDYSDASTVHVRNKLRMPLEKADPMAQLKKFLFVYRYPKYAYRFFKRVIDSFRQQAPRNYLKQPGKNIEDSFMSGREYRRYKIAANRKKAALKKHYQPLAKEPDLSRPYMFVALSYQPEMNTSPCGGAFAHLRLMVDLLSKCVPGDWILYIKEHPVTLMTIKHGERSRDATFYKDLVALPNASLVPLSFSPFKLIDHARAVATVTGTVGWEAVVRQKPVLIFGHPWYEGCEGIFYTPSVEKCRLALKQIINGYEVDIEKVKLFYHVVESLFYRGHDVSLLARASGVSYDDNVDAITSAINNLWRAQQ